MKAWGRREFHMIVPSGVCLQFYVRHLKDLPIQGLAVKMRLRVGRWRRRNSNCERKIFTERVPTIAAPRRLRIAPRSSAPLCCSLAHSSCTKPKPESEPDIGKVTPSEVRPERSPPSPLLRMASIAFGKKAAFPVGQYSRRPHRAWCQAFLLADLGLSHSHEIPGPVVRRNLINSDGAHLNMPNIR
jgi:hypothetical protein